MCESHRQVRAARAVVARQTDNEKTNKRRCEPHGQINKRRRKDEEKTNQERR